MLSSVYQRPGLAAKVLSSGPDHSFILLSTPPKEGELPKDSMSILKITKSPTLLHGAVFPRVAERTVDRGDPDDVSSQAILSYLSLFTSDLKSESGKEYSYHKLSAGTFIFQVKQALHSLLPSPLLPLFFSPGSLLLHDSVSSSSSSLLQYDAELITPATKKQVSKCLPTAGEFVMFEETPSLYTKVVLPYMEKVISEGGTGWVSKIVLGEKELERRLHDCDDWMLGVDTKWTELVCKTLPRDEWKDHECTAQLYCLAIVKDAGLKSLRDLRGHTHAHMLRDIESKGKQVIEQVFGVKGDQIRCYVHYMPQFYQLHVHFTRLFNETNVQVERAHLCADIADNLDMDGDFYEKRTLMYKLPKTDALYNKLREGGG